MNSLQSNQNLIQQKETKQSLALYFEQFAERVSRAAGSSTAFLLAALSVIVWASTGPLFNYSANWQLVINTSTTIITFLMVFLIQKAQNKESMAVQLKLNELIAASKGASNRLVNVENLTEEQLKDLHDHYCQMAEVTLKKCELKKSHSIEETIMERLEEVEDTVMDSIEKLEKKQK